MAMLHKLIFPDPSRPYSTNIPFFTPSKATHDPCTTFTGLFFPLCPSSTTFPPSKASHDPCTTFTGQFLHSVHPLQPSLHRKPLMTHVQTSLAIFPLCPSSTTFPPSKAHHNPCTTFLGHFFCFAHTVIPYKHFSISPSKANQGPCNIIFLSTDSIPCNLPSMHFPQCSLYCVICILAPGYGSQ